MRPSARRAAAAAAPSAQAAEAGEAAEELAVRIEGASRCADAELHAALEAAHELLEKSKHVLPHRRHGEWEPIATAVSCLLRRFVIRPPPPPPPAPQRRRGAAAAAEAAPPPPAWNSLQEWVDRLAPDSDELDGALERVRNESAELSLMMLNGEEPDAPRSADEIAREGDELAADLRAWAARRIRGGGDKRGAGAPAADAPASKRRRPPPKAADLCDAAQVKVVIGNEDLYWGHPSDDDAPGSRHYTTARRSSRLQPAAAAPAAANAKKRRR